MTIIYAFLVGGLICMLSQFVMDKFKLLPIHITCGLVFIGALLDSFNLYDRLISFAGAGALMPISSFGHSIIHASIEEMLKNGYIGLLTGVFNLTAAGITSAIVFAFLVAIIFKPRS